MQVPSLDIFKKKFGAKVFALITVFLFIISLSFTAFFIYQQGASLTDKLLKNARLLTGILAYSVRLGVFSENTELLQNTVEGIYQQEGVLEIKVFSLEEELLSKQKKAEMQSSEAEDRSTIPERLKQKQGLYTVEGSDRLELWSPVVVGASYSTEESLFFEGSKFPPKNTIIGFVKIVVDKTELNKQLNSLLLKSILIGIIFLLTGAVITYLMVKGITKPLNKLTESVKILGLGEAVQEVPVETEDEIGKLASAFNVMMKSLKKREEEKEQLAEQLRHAQKMEAVGTLAGGIAHDFNNILTAIIGFGSLIKMKIDKGNPLRIHVDQILASGERAAYLTQRLLAFSRKQIINPRPLDLNAGIRNLKNLLTRLIREDIELKLLLSNEDLIVKADSGQIDQVLMNLVTNARDAMPEGGTLTIATASVELTQNSLEPDGDGTPGRYAAFSVTDTGIGMDDKTRERIFDPFFTTKEIGHGTGLGLSMVYGIIKQHGGLIDVVSSPGKGATFKILLPLLDMQAEADPSKKQQRVTTGTETVLIAEDDESVRKLTKEILERAGYQVIEAADGNDALKRFGELHDKIHLLLLDVIMPQKNGKEVYEAIRRIRPDIKVLFISGYASDLILKKGIIEEGLQFISKPVTPEALLLEVRKVLDT
ncbi:MAG: response regulator [Deltaproteobacteria bacterium]|nr:response regulator [Deltaproteobacteria bacterium]